MPEERLAAFDPEGDAARRVLLNPHIFRLLGDITGAAVLDAGCGQGYLARMLAGRGARVTGLEPAEAPYQYAVAREHDHPQGICYLQADLSEADGLDGQFDAVAAHTDMPAYPRTRGVRFPHRIFTAASLRGALVNEGNPPPHRAWKDTRKWAGPGISARRSRRNCASTR